jgi:hypothetical protein
MKHEKKKLLAHLGNDAVINLLSTAGCFIAGGAITSIFSNKEINDVDVYFKDLKSLKNVLQVLFKMADADDDYDKIFDKINDDISSHELIYTNHTNKSILFTKGDLKLQFIYFKFFNSPQEIFDTFDFTINMGAYDCSKGEFVLHESFLKDIAQRRLSVNTKTAFPIISLLRVDKYKQRGYSISKKDFVNLCLSVNCLKFETWEQLQNAIGGMYGYIYTDLFDTAKPFSVSEAIEQLSKLETDIVSSVAVAGIEYDKLISDIEHTLNIEKKQEECLFYKKVVMSNDNGVYSSYYSPTFKYTTGKFVNGGLSGIWAYKRPEFAKDHNTFNVPSKENERTIVLKPLPTTKIIRESGRNGTFRLVGDVMVIGEIDKLPNNYEP